MVAAGALAVLIRGADPPPGVRALATWPEGCSLQATRPSPQPTARRAPQSERVACRGGAAVLDYARFERRSELAQAVDQDPPRAPYCVAPTELVVATTFDRRRFAELCADIGGQVFRP